MTRFLWLLALLVLLAACASEPVIVQKTPPQPKDERPPNIKPSSDVFWKTGHWAWKEDPGLYYWVNGSWESPRDGWIWFPGHWEEATDDQGKRLGWVWVDERWERLPGNVR